MEDTGKLWQLTNVYRNIVNDWGGMERKTPALRFPLFAGMVGLMVKLQPFVGLLFCLSIQTDVWTLKQGQILYWLLQKIHLQLKLTYSLQIPDGVFCCLSKPCSHSVPYQTQFFFHPTFSITNNFSLINPWVPTSVILSFIILLELLLTN